MAFGIRDLQVTMTKQASGNVMVVVTDLNSNLKFCFPVVSADFTSFNTTVNGGATGATLSKTYPASGQNAFEYPLGYTGVI